MNFWSTKAATFILHYKTESHSKMGTTMILLLLWSSKWKKKLYLCLGLPKIFSYKRRFLPKEACCEHLIFKGRYMYVWDLVFQVSCEIIWYSKPEIQVLIGGTIHFKHPRAIVWDTYLGCKRLELCVWRIEKCFCV